MATFTKETFRNQQVVVDGNEYIDCTFINCVLVHRGTASPDFIRCTFNGGKIQLEGDATRTTRYLGTLYTVGAVDSVEAVLTRMRKGELPFTQKPAPCPPVATGSNHGRMAIYTGVLVGITLLYLFLFSWAGLTDPRQRLDETNPAAPLRSQIPLELMPALPDSLAVEYDALNNAHREEIATFDWIDRDAGTVRIPIDAAFDILIEQQADSSVAQAQGDD